LKLQLMYKVVWFIYGRPPFLPLPTYILWNRNIYKTAFFLYKHKGFTFELQKWITITQ
jgi:hypothetical protein